MWSVYQIDIQCQSLTSDSLVRFGFPLPNLYLINIQNVNNRLSAVMITEVTAIRKANFSLLSTSEIVVVASVAMVAAFIK